MHPFLYQSLIQHNLVEFSHVPTTVSTITEKRRIKTNIASTVHFTVSNAKLSNEQWGAHECRICGL